MDIKLEQRNDVNALIHVSVNESDYQSKLEKKLEDYRRQATIKGFRPGKAPMSLLKKMIGKEVKMDQVLDIAARSLQDYVREQNLELLGEPIPHNENPNINWVKEKDFSFSYEIGLVPNFSYDIEGLKGYHYKVKISDKEVDAYLENTRLRFGGVENPEESEDGDFIYGEIYQLDKSEDQEKKIFSVETLIPIKKISESERSKFIGVKVGDKIVFDMEKAFPGAKERHLALGIEEGDAAALSGEFVMEVESITRRKLAEMNEEFFAKILKEKAEGEADRTEESVKAKLREQMQELYDKEADELTNIMLRRTLVENTTIELPDDFLKRWLEFSNEGKFTREQIENEYPEFVKEIKWSLIQNRILRDNNVEITIEDIRAEARKEIAAMMTRMGGADLQMSNEQMDAMADNFLKAEDGKYYQSVATQAMRQRAMDTIRAKANLTVKEVSEEEFAEIVKTI